MTTQANNYSSFPPALLSTGNWSLKNNGNHLHKKLQLPQWEWSTQQISTKMTERWARFPAFTVILRERSHSRGFLRGTIGINHRGFFRGTFERNPITEDLSKKPFCIKRWQIRKNFHTPKSSVWNPDPQSFGLLNTDMDLKSDFGSGYRELKFETN